MCVGCSKQPYHRDSSFEYPQHMFWLRNKKNNFQLHTLIWGPVIQVDTNRIVRESDYSSAAVLCSKRPEFLRILSGNVILTSIKGHNLQKMTTNNPNVDFVTLNSYTKFGQNLSICSQEIERKQNFFCVNQGP